MSSLPFVNRAAWIWSSEASHASPRPAEASPSHYQGRLFRRKFHVAAARERLLAHVTGDSRYLFFCNGELVGRGPAKGDVNHHFYESYDLSSRLKPGANVLSAIVLDMSRVAHRPAWLGAPCSVMTYTGGFLLEASRERSEEERLDTGGDGWLVAVDHSFRFQNDGTTFEGYHGYFEHHVSAALPEGWMQPDFDDSSWSAATTLYLAERYENRRDPASPYGLIPRTIPLIEEAPSRGFQDVFLPGGAEAGEPWQLLVVKGTGGVEVAAGETARVVLDAGELTTAFPHLAVRGGAGARVRLTYAEALRLAWETPGARLLGRRQSLANLASHFADESRGWTFDRRGVVTGWSDLWEPRGGAGQQCFEPLHWRAFRYVGLEISAGAEPVRLEAVGHRYSAYPLVEHGKFSCSDPRLDRVWEAGARTMRLCSHETFEDCPHYEQMQYAGDTMITSHLAMLIAGDYALTRQALHHFDWSRLPEGLTQSRFPSRLVQVIPSWSLHWITCARNFAFCSGDLATVRSLWPGMNAVLDWFRRHADRDGLPACLPFWNMTDWCPWWPRGVVPGADTGATCIISAQYIVALDEVAELAGLIGEEVSAQTLSAEAARLRAVLAERFWSEEAGLFHDRPGGPEVSQYGNAWAVVCGAADATRRTRLLQRFPHDAALAPGSFFCGHLVFRALDLCGAYDRMPAQLGPWHEMIDDGLSTFVEENSYWRSLCHAWSAHPLVDFLTRVLGVTPLAPGFARIEIAPRRAGLTRARGTVCTPRGPVNVAWRHEGGVFTLEGNGPMDTPLRLVLPGGVVRSSNGGDFAEHISLP